MWARYGVVILILLLSGLPSAAHAQRCQPVWSDQFPADELNGIVHSFVLFDEDGAGSNPPALFVGGTFTTAGGVAASRIAKWDGTSWSPLGLGITGSSVFALAVYDDDGDGPNDPALYVAGNFSRAGMSSANHIAKWSGTTWSQLSGGTSSTIYALAVYDEDDPNSNPPGLYAGGLFVTAGGVSAHRIARWDGSNWAAVDDGMNSFVSVLAVHDEDGDDPNSNPPALYAGGGFSSAGSTAANHVAKWDGKNWSALETGPLQNGVNGPVYALIGFDQDGSGAGMPALYVGGDFSVAGAVEARCIAKWDGAIWSALGSGMNNPVWALADFDYDAEGAAQAALYAGGYFVTAGGNSANRIAKLDGTTWSPLGSGLDNGVRALIVFDDDGTGAETNPPGLYVGGEFTTAGGHPSGHIAKWGCLGTEPSPPVIITHPQSQTVCEDDSVTFTVTAEGTEPLQYQWRKNGVNIDGANSDSYTIDPVGVGDAGVYDVVVTNDYGSATSDPATLTVDTGPSILQQPESQTVGENNAATFTVVADGIEPLSYRWRKEGIPLNDGGNISGATTDTLTIDPAGPDDEGIYDVVISNDCGTITSETATLTVLPCPGDLDGDLDIDLADLTTLLSHYGTGSGATYEQGDIDGDGDVDLADLTALLAVYGTSCD